MNRMHLTQGIIFADDGSCICEDSGGVAIDVDSEFECLEWPVLGRAYSSLVGPDRAAAI